MPKENQELQKFRSQIDNIDNKIFQLLEERINVVKDVGKLKGEMGNTGSIMRPAREATMIQNVIDRAQNFPPAAIGQIWRMIISGSINVEEDSRVTVLDSSSDRDCFWLSREYFGPFTPMNLHYSVDSVIADIIEKRATVAVLPLYNDNILFPWWLSIGYGDDAPKIFARVPFIKYAESSRPAIVAMGYITPEDNGHNNSLWVVECNEYLQDDMLQKIFADKSASSLNEYMNYETSRHYFLVEIEGFINIVDDELAARIEKYNSKLDISAHFVGSYSRPLII